MIFKYQVCSQEFHYVTTNEPWEWNVSLSELYDLWQTPPAALKYIFFHERCFTFPLTSCKLTRVGLRYRLLSLPVLPRIKLQQPRLHPGFHL